MTCIIITQFSLQWRHNERDGVSSHQPHDCLINDLFRHRWKRASKLHVTGLCEGNSPVTGKFPAQRASNAENVVIWWRHHIIPSFPELTLFLFVLCGWHFRHDSYPWSCWIVLRKEEGIFFQLPIQMWLEPHTSMWCSNSSTVHFYEVKGGWVTASHRYIWFFLNQHWNKGMDG